MRHPLTETVSNALKVKTKKWRVGAESIITDARTLELSFLTSP